MAPLQLGGIRGKNITHNVGWEVLVKSHWSASESFTEHAGQQLKVGYLGYNMIPYLYMVDCDYDL
jgi:hypothetical protein